MNPLVKALILSVLNAAVYLCLRIQDVSAILAWGTSAPAPAQVSVLHFLAFGAASAAVLLLAVYVAGRLVRPGYMAFRSALLRRK